MVLVSLIKSPYDCAIFVLKTVTSDSSYNVLEAFFDYEWVFVYVAYIPLSESNEKVHLW